MGTGRSWNVYSILLENIHLEDPDGDGRANTVRKRVTRAGSDSRSHQMVGFGIRGAEPSVMIPQC
jgi:hypothetical protein